MAIGDKARFCKVSEREWVAIDCVERVEDHEYYLLVYLKGGSHRRLEADKRDELFQALCIPSGETIDVGGTVYPLMGAPIPREV